MRECLDSMTIDPDIPQPDPVADPVPHTERSHHRLHMNNVQLYESYISLVTFRSFVALDGKEP